MRQTFWLLEDSTAEEQEQEGGKGTTQASLVVRAAYGRMDEQQRKGRLDDGISHLQSAGKTTWMLVVRPFHAEAMSIAAATRDGISGWGSLVVFKFVCRRFVRGGYAHGIF